jgi:hypothetical protein
VKEKARNLRERFRAQEEYAMAKTSTAVEVGQESSLREGLEATIRERVREIIEMVLQEEVEAALGAGRMQEFCGPR